MLASEARVRAAIDSMSEGFVLWDADDRLVLCNRPFLDTYPEIADRVRPGLPFQVVAWELARSGRIIEAIGREGEWVADRCRERSSLLSQPCERRLADGRWVRISGHRTLDGGQVSVHTDITELREREAEVRERDAQLRGIVENIPGVVFRRERRPDGSITFPYHSPRVGERYGISAGDIARDPNTFIGAISPHDRPAWFAAVNASARDLTPFAMNLRLVDGANEVRWVRSMATPRRLDDGTVVWDGVSIDITDLKETERALRESEQRYRGLVEAAPIAIVIHHRTRIRFANAKALQLFGARSLADLDGRSILSLVHPEDRALAAARVRRLREEGGFAEPREIRVTRLDGTAVDVESTAVAITEHGEPAVQVVLVDITERKRAQARIQHLAHHDGLTGLPNRSLLLDRLQQSLNEAGRTRHRVAVVMLDLDNFKAINDTRGHLVGDRLLCAVAERLRRTVRASDTLARFGGDEFALVQTGLSHADGARVLAQKMVDVLAEPFQLGDQEIHASASVGVALYPEDGTGPDRLLGHADLALYRAKARGRGRVEFFVHAMNLRARAREAMETDLRQALEQGQLTLAFQPQFELASGRPRVVEAQTRWQHPERGSIPPGRFIPVAEASGLLRPIGRWVLEETCQRAIAWCDGGADCRVSIDLSPSQGRQADLVEQVEQALSRSGLTPDRLELEITERSLLEPRSSLTDRTLRRLAALGVGLVIDDFGAGNASLALLRRLPVDKVKIDRSVIRGIGASQEDEAMVRAVVALVRSLGKRVVAEGIETHAQLAFLEGLGCTDGQGSLLAEAMPASEITSLLTAHARPQPFEPTIALRA
jgi:diguanylate cyclase (GGDEF)-like protein/PAS domain S-box-containing protein